MQSNLLFFAQAGFILLTVIYFALLLKEIKYGVAQTSWDDGKKKKWINKILWIFFGWVVFVSAWSLSDVMSDFSLFPFNFLPVIAIPLIASLVITFSGSFMEVLKNIEPARLIRLQSFRFFVEILLWALFIDNIIPIQMSFEGRNFDILAGITAPVVAWLAAHNRIPKPALIVWNIVCLGLLINIVTVAILSSPTPVRVFMNEPANTIVTYFPVSWLPGMLVPLAYTLHFFSLRQLLTKRETVAATR